MTITFPIDMPTGGVENQYFEIERNDSLTPTNRGEVGGVQAGFPLWKMIITLGNTDEDETGDWSAFKDLLRGAFRTFLGCDLTRRFPRAYPAGFDGMDRAGGGDFDGAASGWSVNDTRDQLTLDGLPAGFKIAKRDYVGFRWTGSKYALVRACEAVVADEDGSCTFTVEPPVPGGDDYEVVPDAATAYLNNPVCLMRLVVQQTNLGPQDVLHTLGGTITAVQDLRQ